jgi:D-alanyl-lipoteichoic acid acyltransferase DltB (MBOAT superfamily)
MSYTIDIYRRRLAPEPNLVTFAAFVAFFPQLVAGPIKRAGRLLPQIRNLNSSPKQVEWGLAVSLILLGLFRKLVIADGNAPLVNQVFASPARFGSLTVLAAVLGFSLQIYGDFAGYTHMARGVAKMFGVDLIENFNAPYLSRSFSEFWRRWHISLSTWLRDYLYIPLGGNRLGARRTYLNLMITMALGGLWHGAGWGFVVWGVLHGLLLVMDRATIDRGRRRQGAPLAPAWVIFSIVTLVWIPFRADSLATAWSVMNSLIGSPAGAHMVSAPFVVGILGFASFVIDRAVVAGRVNPLSRVPAFGRGLGYGTALVVGAMFISLSPVPFIYFQF